MSKISTAAGDWAIRVGPLAAPLYGVILEGHPVFVPETGAPVPLEPGDFWLIPPGQTFAMASHWPVPGRLFEAAVTAMPTGDMRHGDPLVAADTRMLAGKFALGFRDAPVLLSLLPGVIHVRGDARLSSIVQLVTDEARANRPGREVIVTRLLEVMTIEALRVTAAASAPAGLLRGLADPQLASALRAIHDAPEAAHSVQALARGAGLSRTVFFDRFSRAVGQPPMQYLLAWRMALARHHLLKGEAVAQVAGRVGYGSASAFTTAFTRFTGQPPGRFARMPEPEEA